jgi:probable H4MPT-linked C1 transfer pathway protein
MNKLVKVLGLDIGGANTKAALLRIQEGTIQELGTVLEYFPVWKKDKEKLPEVLRKLKKGLVKSAVLDGVGVTITAELSDAYMTKKEGINHVLDCVTQVFRKTPIFILDVEANLLQIKEARKKTLKVASANWAATGWMTSQLIKNCIVVDVGSTTTSIIPVINGKLVAEGRTDLEKLHNGELVYSGTLRTNVATIVNSIPVHEKITRISSELFAQSGDVHLLLDNIREKEYTTETCDGRGKTRREAAARLTRVVCADIDMLNDQDIVDMAQFVYDQQVDQITRSLKQVSERIRPLTQERIRIVVTGLGRNFLARKAAEKAGFMDIIDMREFLGVDATVVSTSVGVALMVASKLEGKTEKWKQS